MKALVLAGGKGTRLRPLTHTMAKQLIPVANKPILDYVMQHLREAEILDVGVIVSPETGAQVGEFLRGQKGFRFSVIQQEEPLGLAHAVATARSFLADEPFVMYLGDNLIGQGIRDFIEAFHASDADAVILLKRVPDPRLFGVAVVNPGGRIERLVEKPKSFVSDLALVGVYVFSPAIHQAIASIRPSWRGELEITDAIQSLLDTDHEVRSFELKDWWLDTGKKDDLLEANRAVLDKWTTAGSYGEVDSASRIVGRVYLETGTRICRSELRGPLVVGQGTVIEDAFIGPFTSIASNCTIRRTSLEHCVVLDHVVLDGPERIEDSILGRNAVVRNTSENRRALRLMIGDDAEVSL